MELSKKLLTLNAQLPRIIYHFRTLYVEIKEYGSHVYIEHCKKIHIIQELRHFKFKNNIIE